MHAMICSDRTGNLYWLDNGDVKVTTNTPIVEPDSFLETVHNKLELLQTYLDSLDEPMLRFRFSYNVYVGNDEDAITVHGHKVSGRSLSDAENHLILMNKECYPKEDVEIQITYWEQI
jgi:hypothetical protein